MELTLKVSRDKLFYNAREHVEVDIYGDCGALKCDGTSNRKAGKCVEMLAAKYKFYLALEDS